MWNSPSKIAYNHKGKSCKDYLGNYWSDYEGIDLKGDGIGDTPYSIDSDRDNYPLLQPWEYYFVPIKLTFGDRLHPRRFYFVNLDYDNGDITLDNVYVTPRDIVMGPETVGNYRCEILSFKGDVLYESNFEVRTDYSVPDMETGEPLMVHQKEANIHLEIPYFENGKSIDIYDSEDNKVLSVDVSCYADVCGDSICEPHESYGDCPEDCPSGGKDDYCDRVADGICDPDCFSERDIDCKSEKEGERFTP